MINPVLLSSVHCIRDVAVPFVAATVAAVGTGLYLNKVLAKVTVVLINPFPDVAGYIRHETFLL